MEGKHMLSRLDPKHLLIQSPGPFRPQPNKNKLHRICYPLGINYCGVEVSSCTGEGDLFCSLMCGKGALGWW